MCYAQLSCSRKNGLIENRPVSFPMNPIGDSNWGTRPMCLTIRGRFNATEIAAVRNQWGGETIGPQAVPEPAGPLGKGEEVRKRGLEPPRGIKPH